MKYKATILNVTAGLFLLGCIINTLVNYKTLSAGEGWGVVYMFGIGSFGVAALVVDLVIQVIRNIWKRKRKATDNKSEN